MILEIVDLARGGAGVARDPDGRVVFVPFSAPGDQVRVQVLKSQKNYGWAEIQELIKPSPHRETPPCPAFGQCGGCQWQHIPYALQWETKVKGLKQALSQAKVLLPQQFDQIPATQIWGYRNRIQLRGNKSELGFFKPNTHEIIDVKRCDIARSEINAAWENIRKEGAARSVPYKVEVEVTPTGQIQKTWNSPHGAAGFRQVHDEQNEKLRSWILNSIQPSHTLYDLYGGSGNLSLPLVEKFDEIHCVDTGAKTLPQGAIPRNLHFHKSPVAPWIGKRADQKKEQGPSSAILDPPREGLARDLPRIAAALESLGVKEIVAVGCDLDSWVKDLKGWTARGWALKRVMAIDLFPQTTHIESVGLLAL